MDLQQVSDHCFAVLNEKNRVCDANSGLINLAGGVVIDTQSDLAHARRMIELFGTVWCQAGVEVYREFRHEPPDAPWDTAATFDAIYKVANARGIPVEF